MSEKERREHIGSLASALAILEFGNSTIRERLCKELNELYSVEVVDAG